MQPEKDWRNKRFESHGHDIDQDADKRQYNQPGSHFRAGIQQQADNTHKYENYSHF